MSLLHNNIESVLKQKVHQNYRLFLDSNREINKISVDINELHNLVEDTKILVEVNFSCICHLFYYLCIIR